MGKFSIFECPNCHSRSTAGSWNSATLRTATEKHKKMRTKIQDAGNAPNLSYVCPNCGSTQPKNKIRGRFATDEHAASVL